VALFAKSHRLPVSAVAGVRAGSLHTTTDPATHDEWAYAHFVPSDSPYAVALQGGGGIGVFTRAPKGQWEPANASVANGCGSGLPSTVATAWKLNQPALCGSASASHAETRSALAPQTSDATTTGVGPIATTQVGVDDNPETNSFNLESADCDPYTAIDGVSATDAPECDADSSVTNANGTVTTVQNQGEYWCADFAKWVWQQAGVNDTGVLDPGADSFYTWGHDQGETLSVDGTNPQVGDAVVLYGQLDGGAGPGLNVEADHVGIITNVYTNGNVDTVNGDFQGASTIGVYQWTDMSLSSYAATAEGSGETWVLVPPILPATPPASISSFSAAPSTVPAGGGSVTLTADASNASSYAFTSTSSAVTGLGSVDSSSGSAQDAVEIPATQAAVTYTFDVTATGAGGTSAESPVTVTQSAPVYEEAFESNKQQLVTYGSIDQNSDEPMLAAGSSPALAALPGGGTEEAYVNPSGALNLWGSGGSYATGQGVESGTNPSIAAASSGGFEVVFMAAGSGGKLYTWTSTGDKTTDTGQLMAAGSSPTVAAVSGGGYEIAFAAISTGYLCVLGSALDDNTGQGIETGTRAAIAGASSGGFKVAFMAAGTGGKMYTWTSTGEATTNTGQGMQGGTSPAITT